MTGKAKVSLETLKELAINRGRTLKVVIDRMRLPCPFCQRTYQSKDALLQHLKQHHNICGEKVPACVKTFPWPRRRDVCSGCKGVYSRVREHQKKCKAFKNAIKKTICTDQKRVGRMSID